METKVEHSYSSLLEMPGIGNQVIWLGSSSKEEAIKEAKAINIKYIYEHETITITRRIEIE